MLAFRHIFLILALFSSTMAQGQEMGQEQGQNLSALARFAPAVSEITARRGGVDLTLAISQPVPWRLRALADPPRIVLDLREVDWTGIAPFAETVADETGGLITGLRAGAVQAGWSRMVLALAEPMAVESAEMVTEGQVTLNIRLTPTSPESFATEAARPDPPQWALPEPADLPPSPGRGDGPVVIVLDPGHGGIDPGAERAGLNEADIVLSFAREFKEYLLREGGFQIVLTRDEDVFVPLETRISIARAAGADVFLSLHADALPEGEAVGATLYTLDEEASSEASRTLAERHDRDDLLSGVDLTAQDDLVAQVLMDMARTETRPRTARLALMLEEAIKGQGLAMHRIPHQTAGFSVLKSPDIPSILIELGFMSSDEDLARLTDPVWREKMLIALADGVRAWVAEDAALSAAAAP